LTENWAKHRRTRVPTVLQRSPLRDRRWRARPCPLHQPGGASPHAPTSRPHNTHPAASPYTAGCALATIALVSPLLGALVSWSTLARMPLPKSLRCLRPPAPSPVTSPLRRLAREIESGALSVTYITFAAKPTSPAVAGREAPRESCCTARSKTGTEDLQAKRWP